MSEAVAALWLCERARAVSLCRTHSTRFGVLFVVGPIGFVFSISPLFLSRIAWAFSIIVIIFTWFRFFLCSKFSAVGLCFGGGRRERNERTREKKSILFFGACCVCYLLAEKCVYDACIFIYCCRILSPRFGSCERAPFIAHRLFRKLLASDKQKVSFTHKHHLPGSWDEFAFATEELWIRQSKMENTKRYKMNIKRFISFPSSFFCTLTFRMYSTHTQSRTIILHTIDWIWTKPKCDGESKQIFVNRRNQSELDVCSCRMTVSFFIRFSVVRSAYRINAIHQKHARNRKVYGQGFSFNACACAMLIIIRFTFKQFLAIRSLFTCNKGFHEKYTHTA